MQSKDEKRKPDEELRNDSTAAISYIGRSRTQEKLKSLFVNNRLSSALPLHWAPPLKKFASFLDCELDSQPNHLTTATDYLILIDTAFAFATSYPPLMRPERKVDVILHFNYSSGSQTGVSLAHSSLLISLFHH